MSLSRRTLLRGTSALLALPLLEAMMNSHGTALAQGAPIPKRFAVWFFGNGVRLDRWVPKVTGANWQLSEELAPLVDATRKIDVKRYVNVVSGYNVAIPDRRGHHTGVVGMMSGAPFIELPANNAPYSSKFSIKSIDQIAADTIGKGTAFSSLQLAVSKRMTKGEGPTLQYLSHRGPDEPLPQEVNPAALFTRLFSNVQTAPSTDPRDQLRVSVLDAVRDDAKRLQAKLGAADKARLDAHLTAVSEVRSKILTLPPVVTSACVKPPNVTETNKDVNGVEPYEIVSNLMSDMLAIAWACDLNRVATMQFSGSVGGHSFRELSGGQPRDNEHAITHDANQQDKVHDAVVFTMRNFAYFLDKLQKTPDGQGNLLDRSCILCTSDLAEGLVHSKNDYPILVAGSAGGALKSPGIHVRSANGANTSDVLLSCLQAVGTGVSSVGKDEGLSTSACKDILA
jgi:Protein of unknown function (DUF1552)